jgi:hypothetical protein
MIRSKPKVLRALHYLLLLVMALVFAAVFYYNISPIVTQETEFDVSCFHVIGSAILEGRMPYLNFIDNKGPVQYFVYAFTALFFDFPWGIFLFSTLLVFASLILVEQICKRLRIPHAFWVLPLYLFFYVCVCSSGGMTEDFSLPLTLCAFLIYLNVEESLRNHQVKAFNGFYLALLFWLCSFTRINNALSIGLITAVIFVQLLIKREFQKTAAFASWFAAGTVAIVLPIVFWLFQNGAFWEFLDQFLLNNFKYSSADGAMPKVELLFRNRFGLSLIMLLIQSILGTVIFFRRSGKERRSLFVATLVVLLGTAVSFVSMTMPYTHYRLVLMVPAFFGFILQYAYLSDLPKENRKNRIFVAFTTVVCIIGMVFSFGGKMKLEVGLDYAKDVSASILQGKLFEKTETEREIERLAAHIPTEERDSVFSVDADPKFYAFTGIFPAKRMFVCQPLFTKISDAYRNEFLSYFEDDPPKWLVTEEPLESIDVSDTKDQLNAMYRLVDEADIFYLYVLNEPYEID